MKKNPWFSMILVAMWAMAMTVGAQERSKAEIACEAVNRIVTGMSNDFSEVTNIQDGTCTVQIFPGIVGNIQKNESRISCVHVFYSGEDEAMAIEWYGQLHRLLNSCGLEGEIIHDKPGSDISDPSWEFALKGEGSGSQFINLNLIKPWLGPKIYKVELEFKVIPRSENDPFQGALDILNNMQNE